MSIFDKNVLNEIETAEYLGLSRATLRRGRMNGLRETHIIAPPYLKVGRSIKYLKADLDTWLLNQRVDPSANAMKHKNTFKGT